MRLFVGTILLFVFGVINAQPLHYITDRRARILDSITSNIPKEIKGDFKALHSYLHHAGKNDEERIFMYFGYIAGNLKYDRKLAYSKRLELYSPEYTCRKKSGVCIDFAELFEALCDASEIPCFTVKGDSKKKFKDKWPYWVRLRFRRIGHAWNVVYYDSTWHCMDPTWSRVDSTKKYYSTNAKGKKEVSGKHLFVNRRYYNGHPDNFVQDHRPYHPAFFLREKVPTVKTSFKLESKMEYFAMNYPYEDILDSLVKLDTVKGVSPIRSISPCHFHYYFSDEVQKYTGEPYRLRVLQAEQQYINQKTSRSMSHTKQDLIDHLTRMHYLLDSFQLPYDIETCNYLEEVVKRIHRMERREGPAAEGVR